MLDHFVNSSGQEHPKILRPNGQRQHNFTHNLEVDDNPPVRKEEYKKRRGVKNRKT